MILLYEVIWLSRNPTLANSLISAHNLLLKVALISSGDRVSIILAAADVLTSDDNSSIEVYWFNESSLMTW